MICLRSLYTKIFVCELKVKTEGRNSRTSSREGRAPVMIRPEPDAETMSVSQQRSSVDRIKTGELGRRTKFGHDVVCLRNVSRV